jgi:hypothetical protein
MSETFTDMSVLFIILVSVQNEMQNVSHKLFSIVRFSTTENNIRYLY